MKIIIKILLCIFLLSSITNNSLAQDKPIITKEPKFKPPVVKTYLGVNQNGAQVTVDEGVQLVGLPLKIVDAKTIHTILIRTSFFTGKNLSSLMRKPAGKKKFLLFLPIGFILHLYQKSGLTI